MTENKRLIKEMTDKIKNMDIPRYGFVAKKQPEKIDEISIFEAQAQDFINICGAENA